jgi:sec-independent protein translocase protein TatB
MFDIGWTEITVILIVAIIVIGPKDLPRVLRTVGQWVGKAKSMTGEFRGHVDDMIRDTELDDVKNQIQSISSFDADSALENTIDADGEIKSAFDFSGDEFSNPVDLNDPSYDEEDPNGTAAYNDSKNDEQEELVTELLPSVSDEAPEGVPQIKAEKAEKDPKV